MAGTPWNMLGVTMEVTIQDIVDAPQNATRARTKERHAKGTAKGNCLIVESRKTLAGEYIAKDCVKRLIVVQ